MLIVQKFGGSSVADTEKINRAAQRIVDTYKSGHKVVVVLSAQGDTTDDLISKAKEINPEPSKRELDMLMATGEQQSCALMAMAIHRLGFPAISLNAVQVGISAFPQYGNARISRMKCDRIYSELERNSIVIVTGFQGINQYGDISTLGRGGSDTTAVAIAAEMQADLCEIYTDVDGVYTADPRMIKNAKKLKEISYDEMLELASLGAVVLHNRSVELAKKYNVKLVVRSSITDAEGTVVKEESQMESTYISGIALDRETAQITLIGMKDDPGLAFKIFSFMGRNKISVDVIIQSIGRQSVKDISFTVATENLDDTIKLLEKNKDFIGYSHIIHDANQAKLSVVGAGMATNPGVAAAMFEALADANISINMISTSEIKISVLINKQDAEQAVRYVHNRFFEQGVEF